MKQDYIKAKKFFLKACNDGYSAGCYNLGVMYEHGDGVNQDYAKSKEFFTKACKSGSEDACSKIK